MPPIALVHNLNKEQYGRVHKHTMNLFLQDIISSYSMLNYVFSPIFLFFMPTICHFPFFTFLSLFIYWTNFTSILVYPLYFRPPFIPFPLIFFLCWTSSTSIVILLNLGEIAKKKGSAICKCIVFIIHSFFHKRLWFKNKMKILQCYLHLHFIYIYIYIMHSQHISV
jgi:hypothetical protein